MEMSRNLFLAFQSGEEFMYALGRYDEKILEHISLARTNLRPGDCLDSQVQEETKLRKCSSWMQIVELRRKVVKLSAQQLTV